MAIETTITVDTNLGQENLTSRANISSTTVLSVDLIKATKSWPINTTVWSYRKPTNRANPTQRNFAEDPSSEVKPVDLLRTKERCTALGDYGPICFNGYGIKYFRS